MHPSTIHRYHNTLASSKWQAERMSHSIDALGTLGDRQAPMPEILGRKRLTRPLVRLHSSRRSRGPRPHASRVEVNRHGTGQAHGGRFVEKMPPTPQLRRRALSSRPTNRWGVSWSRAPCRPSGETSQCESSSGSGKFTPKAPSVTAVVVGIVTTVDELPSRSTFSMSTSNTLAPHFLRGTVGRLVSGKVDLKLGRRRSCGSQARSEQCPDVLEPHSSCYEGPQVDLTGCKHLDRVVDLG